MTARPEQPALQVPPVPTPPSAPPDARRELKLLVRSHFQLVFVETPEEERAEEMIADVARATNSMLFTWSLTTGLVARGEDHNRDTVQPADALRVIRRTAQNGMYVMRDLVDHFDDPVVVRLLRDFAASNTGTIFVLCTTATVPDPLRVCSAVYQLPRPDATLIESRVRTILQQLGHRGDVVNELDDTHLAMLVQSLRGLTLGEVDQIVTRLIAEDGRLSVGDVDAALKAKAEHLARQGVVELVNARLGLDWVAGFENLKKWLAARRTAFLDGDARDFGLDPPKGMLLTGVPGCGKSFVVKALAVAWKVPLLRLDAGALFDKYVGESERNLRRALETAEALAPSILWIDEIEKGFAVTGPSESDGGLGYRMVGTLATWMQERELPVFIAATSNDITVLPPELTRQGRFDEIFFVDLPTMPERQHMFAIQLSRRGRDWQAFDCAELAAMSDGFSGSEIEQAVTNALYSAYAAGHEISTADVLGELSSTRPLAAVSPAKVASIREWGSVHARKA